MITKASAEYLGLVTGEAYAVIRASDVTIGVA